MALALVPIILVVLLIAYGGVHARYGWPSDQYQGWVLLSILGLSLLPVFLVILGFLASVGARLGGGGVELSFANASVQAEGAVRSTYVSENLGTLDSSGQVDGDALQNILEALADAHRSDVTVVDLGRGKTWWESRLFILIAGAARRPSPQAIAFVDDENGRSGVFVGWASPEKLLRSHLEESPATQGPYDRAVALSRQWEIGFPKVPQPGLPAGPPEVQLPWSPDPLSLPPLERGDANPGFAFELFLQQQLAGSTASQDLRKRVTVVDVTQRLYRSPLITDSIDINATDDQWAKILVEDSRRFFAVVEKGSLRSLIPRDALLTALVAPLAKEIKRPG